MEKTKQDLTLSTLYETIKNIDDENIENLDFKNIYEFTKNNITKKVAENNIEQLKQMHQRLNEVNVPPESRKNFKKVISYIMNLITESRCKDLLLNQSCGRIKEYKSLVDKMEEMFQTERNEHNELRKKHNEELKPEKVSLPGFSLSLTTKQNKFLTNKECNDIANELEIDKQKLEERFKRISVPKEYKNKVDRVYLKKAEEGEKNIIMKNGKK